MTPLDRACKAAGGPTALARKLRVTYQAIWNWRRSGVPVQRCCAIEDATRDPETKRPIVTRAELRPDIWGAA